MTELIWDGKYVRWQEAVAGSHRSALSKIETVMKSAADRMRTMEMFASGRESE